MRHKFDPANKHRLTDAERRKLLPPKTILESIPIAPGQSVADIGCGVGYFTVPLAELVQPGRVYGFDILPEMVEATQTAVAKEALGNVEVAVSQESSIPLPDGAVDGVFLSVVLHEAKDPVVFLTELRRILRPGGWLAIIEWQKKETESGPPLDERLSPEDTEERAVSAGFRPELVKILNDFHYLQVFRA